MKWRRKETRDVARKETTPRSNLYSDLEVGRIKDRNGPWKTSSSAWMISQTISDPLELSMGYTYIHKVKLV